MRLIIFEFAAFQQYQNRRIDDEHRLVYKVTDESIIIALCYSHYNNK